MTIQVFSRDIVPVLQLVVSFLGLLSLVGLFVQIWLTRIWNKIEAFYSFYNFEKSMNLEKELFESLKNIGIELKEQNEGLKAELIDKIYANNEIYFVVKTFLDDLEYFCAAIQIGAINSNLAYNVHSLRVSKSYNIFKNFIQKMRQIKKDDEIYLELEKTALQWRIKSKKMIEKQQKIILKSKKEINRLKGIHKTY